MTPEFKQFLEDAAKSDTAMVGICAPVSIAPTLPAVATYSTYEQTPCPGCGEGMWLGAEMKLVRDNQGLVPVCMLCAIATLPPEELDPSKIILLNEDGDRKPS